jgi:hypothetical protein
MKKALENIFWTLAAVTMILFVTFCYLVWLAGYDSLFQYFNMMI